MIHLIAVPYDSGRRAERMGAGPLRLLSAGVVERLAGAGHRAHATIVDAPDGMWPGEIATAFNLAGQVATLVRTALDTGAFPLILSGNCGPAAWGAIAGAEDVSRVFWFDAHADFNTPESTIGGFLDGMALATLTGRCWRQLASGLGGFEPMPEESVTLIGARDLDPLEAEALATSKVHTVPAAGVSRGITARLADVGPSASYVHLDVDVLDPSEARMNSYAAAGGLTIPELRDAVAAIGNRTRIAVASMTAFDPALDPSGRALEVAISLCVELTSRCVDSAGLAGPSAVPRA